MEKINKLTFIRIVFLSLYYRLSRISIIFFALLVSSIIVTSMVMVYFDVNIKMSEELKVYGANFYITSKDKYLTKEDYEKVLSLDKNKIILASTPYLYSMVRSEKSNISIVGINFNQIKKVEPFWQLQGNLIIVDFDDRNAILGKGLANQLGLKLNDNIKIFFEKDGITIDKLMRIKGIVETGGAIDNMLIIHINELQNWLNLKGKINYISFVLNGDAMQVEEFGKFIEKNIPNINAEPIRMISQAEGNVLYKIQGLMGLVSLVILILSIICVNTSLIDLVRERSREFALAKALGAKDIQIIGLLTVEIIIITLISSIVGLVLGYYLAQILGKTVFNSSINFRMQVVIITIFSILLASIIAIILPLKRIMQIEAAVTLKGE